MDEGFVNSDLNNLPHVDYLIMHENFYGKHIQYDVRSTEMLKI